MNYYFNTSTLYVSQKSGIESNNGLEPFQLGDGIGPVQTIERALEKVGELRVSGDNRPVQIMLVDDYHMSSTLEISDNTPGHRWYSGVNADNIVIESYGERKSIIGGRKLEGWVKDKFNGKDCYSAKLEKNINGEYPNFTDLYINGERADYTRFPLDDSLLEAIDTEINDGIDFGKCSNWFVAKPDAYKALEGEKNALITYWHCWIHEQNPVKAFDVNTGKVDFGYETRLCINTFYEQKSAFAFKYFIENVKAGFAKENQWYYDYDNGVVYYIPRKDVDINSLEIYYPVVQQLFVIKGTRENKIKRVNFRNLNFLYTKGDNFARKEAEFDDPNWTLEIPSGKACDGQGIANAHGAIEYAWAENSYIENCKFASLGVYAINVLHGCNNMRIENNEISQMAAGGIKIGGGKYQHSVESRTHDNIIRGNFIHHICLRNWSAIGIIVKESYNNVIEENEICNTEYTAISVGWCWGYANNVSRDNIIRNNYLHDIGGDRLNDMGGIYLLGRQPGTIISGNRIIRVKGYRYMAWGIYLDEGTAGVTIENNVISDTLSPGFVIHFGTNNVIRNNIFAFGSQGGFAINRPENHNSCLFQNNIFVLDDVPFVESNIWQHLNPGVLNNNLIWDVKNSEPYILNKDKTKLPLSEASKIYNVNNYVVEDPMFVDCENRDFTLKENSPASKIGFIPISGFTASGKR